MRSRATSTINCSGGFDDDVRRATGGPLRGVAVQTVQVNIGLTCNMACRHCHLGCSPTRTEQMDWPTMENALEAARRARAKTLDITGGAPEMHPRFRQLIQAARAEGLNIIVRTNLSIMLEEGYSDLPQFLHDRQVRLVASLPCYLEENVDRQRGKHAHRDSITVLRRLNAVGYGNGSGLSLDLVFNPLGPSLPPDQANLEAAYRRELDEGFGICFTRLVAMTNLSIGRFGHELRKEGLDEGYRQLLKDAFNPQTIVGLMCRHQLHVGHDGTMYDCDFNCALNLPAATPGAHHVRDFDPETYVRRHIATGQHCYGCAAGAGSSCAGTIV